jgi:hypothetical protein
MTLTENTAHKYCPAKNLRGGIVKTSDKLKKKSISPNQLKQEYLGVQELYAVH